MVVKHVMMSMASSCNVSSKCVNELIGTSFFLKKIFMSN